MTKNEAKKIAIDRIYSILSVPDTWFESAFESVICEFNDEEKELILLQAYKVSMRLIRTLGKQ